MGGLPTSSHKMYVVMDITVCSYTHNYSYPLIRVFKVIDHSCNLTTVYPSSHVATYNGVKINTTHFMLYYWLTIITIGCIAICNELNIKQLQVVGQHGVHGANALTQLAVTMPLLVSVIEQEPVQKDLECLMTARELTLSQEVALLQQVLTCSYSCIAK